MPASSADRPGDLSALRRAGLLVYLQAPVSVLVARVEADPPRPWLDDDVAVTLGRMAERRDPALARAAELVVDAGLPLAHCVSRISELVESSDARTRPTP